MNEISHHIYLSNRNCKKYDINSPYNQENFDSIGVESMKRVTNKKKII